MSLSSDNWPAIDQVPDLTPGVIHVWRVPLVAEDVSFLSLRSILSADERRRADRFLFEHHRHRFTVGRAHVRRILGRYLHQPAESVGFRYTNLGKPFLPADGPEQPPRFNFSNSADWGLLAISAHLDLGVDIERIRVISNMEGLARRFFAPAEIDAIMSQSTGQSRESAFFRCWTRKEAFLKAVGKGLTFPLDRVCVTVDEAAPVSIVAIDENRNEGARWSLTHLEPVHGYVGALARISHEDEVKCFAWSG